MRKQESTLLERSGELSRLGMRIDAAENSVIAPNDCYDPEQRCRRTRLCKKAEARLLGSQLQVPCGTFGLPSLPGFGIAGAGFEPATFGL